MTCAPATAVWRHAGLPVVPIRWVLVRDPLGRFDPQALLCTDPNQDPLQVLRWFIQRWQVETTFQETRAHLGVETQRQWSDRAIARTTPCLLGLFSLVTLLAAQLSPTGTRGRYERGLVSQTPPHLQRHTRRCAATFLAGTGFIHLPPRGRRAEIPAGAPQRHRPCDLLCRIALGQLAKVEIRTPRAKASSVSTKLRQLQFHTAVLVQKGDEHSPVHRTLGVTLKTAWFMTHRIREAMREGKLPGGMGGEGKFVEADETYVGGKAKNRAYAEKLPRHEPVVALVERKGRVKSFHVPNVNVGNLRPIIKEQISPKSDLRTDESKLYTEIGKSFASHETVNHSVKEYVRGDAHTNTSRDISRS